MNIFVIENDDSVAKLLVHPEYRVGRDLVVCFNYLPFLRMAECGKGHNFRFIEDFFTSDSYRKLHGAIDFFAQNWYRIGSDDPTLFEGISYGEISEIIFTREYLLGVLVKYGEALRLAFRSVPEAKAVYYDLSNESNYFYLYVHDLGRFFNKRLLIETVARQLGLVAVYIKPDRLIPARFIASGPYAEQLAARMKRFAKRGIGAVLNLFSRVGFDSTTPSTYVFNYSNLQSLLLNLRGRTIISTLPRSIQEMGVGYVDFQEITYVANLAESNFLARLRAKFLVDNRLQTACEFKYNDIDYRDLYAPAIKDLLNAKIPQLLGYARQVDTALQRYRIKRIICVDVMTEMGKLRVGVCRRNGVETIFIDHGIMGHRHAHAVSYGYSPDLIVKPDDIDPYTDAYPYSIKAPSVKLGNPSTDFYPMSKRKRITAIKRVLLTTFSESFYARLDRVAYQERYFKELLAVVAPLQAMGIEVHFRTHSESDAYHDYLFAFFGVERSAVVESSWSRPFSDVIYEMDLLVCSVSNIFYEAQAAGIPTLFLDPYFVPDALFPPCGGKNMDEVMRVGTGEEVVNIIRRNQHNPSELNHFLDSFLENHAPRFMGPLDGEAGLRIAGYLDSKTRGNVDEYGSHQ